MYLFPSCLSLGLFKNHANPQVVSHSELKDILSDFKHSVIGSVKASMMDAMRRQRADQERPPPVLSPQSSLANPMEDSEESDQYMDSESSDSDVEAW